MPALDRFIDAMTRHGSRELLLASGERPILLFEQGPRPLSDRTLSAPQILGLLQEVGPPTFRRDFDAQPALRFPYRPPTGPPVSVAIQRGSGSLRVSVRREGENERAVAPPPPDPHPAPAAVPNGVAPVAPAAARAGSSPEESLASTEEGRPGMERLLRIAVERNASDLHVSAGNPPLLRVDGELEAIDGWPALPADLLARKLVEMLPDANRREYEETNDTDFAYQLPGICRFRSNLYRDIKGPAGAFRRIPNEIVPPEQLGLTKEVLDLCFLTKGLVIVTGPTGSGKSTTLATLLDYTNRNRADHIITIEDPIEFVHPNKRCLVNQRQVGPHTDSFKRALRAALREDPDIVLVGEMRDLETVAIAIETAETGHLVFGTLHTTTACSTVDRIVDQFPADQQEQIRVMLADTLKAVIAQVLCRKKGGGRVAAFEFLFGLQSITNLIREGKTFQIPTLMQTGKKYGMRTMNQSLAQLAQDGIVEAREAYVRSVDKQEILQLFDRANISFDPDSLGSAG